MQVSDAFSGGYKVCRFRSKHLRAVIQWSCRGGRVDERDLASVGRGREREREREMYPRTTWGKQGMTEEKRKSLFITKGSNFSATYQLLHPCGSYLQRLSEPIWWKARIKVTCTLFTSLHRNTYAWDRRCHWESHSTFLQCFLHHGLKHSHFPVRSIQLLPESLFSSNLLYSMADADFAGHISPKRMFWGFFLL